MASEVSFKLTYATMFNPPEELHTRFEAALSKIKPDLGKEHGMLIGGKEYFSAGKFEDRSPANTDLILGVFQKGDAQDAQAAIAAAKKSEKKSEAVSPTLKMEFPPVAAKFTFISPEPISAFSLARLSADSSFQKPPLPPPREFFV